MLHAENGLAVAFNHPVKLKQKLSASMRHAQEFPHSHFGRCSHHRLAGSNSGMNYWIEFAEPSGKQILVP